MRACTLQGNSVSTQLARSRTARGPGLVSALSALFVVTACGAHKQAPTSNARVERALDLSPARQVDWLPANASAVLHFDVAKLRSTRLYQELQGLLPARPPVRQVLERTDNLRVAVVTHAAEPQIVALFSGNYDTQVNPSMLGGEQLEAREQEGVRVLEHARSHEHWFRTPEGFWICSESALFSEVFPSPDTRSARLYGQPWARAPQGESLLHAAVLMSPVWRDEAAQNLTDPISSSLFLPAVEELSVLRFDVETDGTGGYMLELSADFASSRGAQSAAFVVQALLLAAKTRASADTSMESQSVPMSGDEAFDFGHALGRTFGGFLDDMVLDVQGTHASASLILAAELLDELRMRVREAATKAAQSQGSSAP
jgi:hypothetical protein